MMINSDIDNKKKWGKVLIELELTVSPASFSTWFKDTFIIKQDGGTIFLGVPNEFVKNWLNEKYHKTILKSLRNLDTNIRSLEYSVIRNNLSKETNQVKQTKNSFNTELPLENFYINKEDNLNPRYVFDSFIIGSFNELAYAASQAVIKKPGSVYNPLFIYGNTGYGKTHLIQAIGNHIKEQKTDKKVYYMTSEKFSVDYVNSVQKNSVNIFKEKYKKYDVLIIDDIQFLSNKEKTQEELFHLFNNLHDNNKQIIFSSDKHPNYIPGLEDRLKSRFGSGMIVDVQSPDHESRVEILRSKARFNNFNLPDEIIDFLALSIQGNIRELESSFNSITCQSQLKGRSLTLLEVKNLIKNTIKPKKTLSIQEVAKTVSDFYNIEESSIYEKTRRKEVVKPRQVIMYILREDFNISYPTIGNKLGGRDHTTVIHSYNKIKNDIKKDNLLLQELEQIRSIFG